MDDGKWARVSLAAVFDERPSEWPDSSLGDGKVSARGRGWFWCQDFWLEQTDPIEVQFARLSEFLACNAELMGPFAEHLDVRISWSPVDSQHCLGVPPHLMALMAKIGCSLLVDTYVDEQLVDEERGWRSQPLPAPETVAGEHVFAVVRVEQSGVARDFAMVSCWSSEAAAAREADRLNAAVRCEYGDGVTYGIRSVRWQG